MDSARADALLADEFGAAALNPLQADAAMRALPGGGEGQALAYVQATQFDSTLCLRAPQVEQKPKADGGRCGQSRQFGGFCARKAVPSRAAFWTRLI